MNKTILLADDSLTIRKVVELTFLGSDRTLVAVGDGNAALQELHESKPDVVLADVHMPGLDGYEVCQESKVLYPDIPVLLLVGTFEYFDSAKATRVGFDAFIKKPFDSGELSKEVDRLLDLKPDQIKAPVVEHPDSATHLESLPDGPIDSAHPSQTEFTDTAQGQDNHSAGQIHLTFNSFDDFVEQVGPQLSLQGVFLQTTYLPPVGSVQKFELTLPDGFKLIRGTGQVVWVRKQANGPQAPQGIALRFQELSPMGKGFIQRALKQIATPDREPFDVERIPPGVEAARYEQTFEKFATFVEEYSPWLSSDGMFLRSDHLRPVGSRLSFSILLEDGFKLFEGVGEVIWKRSSTQDLGEPSGMGLRFLELPEESRKLALLIEEHQTKRGGPPFDVHQGPLGFTVASSTERPNSAHDLPMASGDHSVSKDGEARGEEALSRRNEAPESNSLEARIAVLETELAMAAPTSLKPQIEVLESNLEALKSDLTATQRRLRDSIRDYEDLKERVDRTSRWPARFLDLQQRVETATAAPPSEEPPAWQSLSAEELRSRLTQGGFFLSQDVADSLWSALVRKKLIVLEGVPGTGKSKLAQLLAEVLLEPHAELGLSFSEVKVHPDLTVEEFIGGRTITQDNRVGPKCGPLLEAMLRCHESADGHWLLMDEFNRGSVDVIFAPLLDALVRDDGTVQHPHMFPDRDAEAAHVPIPQGFRIIGTMNPLDQGIFEISQALLQRIQVVAIPALRGDDELSMIQVQVLQPWLDAEGDATHAATRSQWSDLALDTSRRLQDLAEQVRALTNRTPAAQFAHCELGSRVVKDAVEALLLRLDDNGEDIAKDLVPVLDALVRDAYLPQLKSSGTEALQTLVSEVFSQSSYPLTAEALERLIDQRRAF